MRVAATLRFEGGVDRVADRGFARPGVPSIDPQEVLWLDGRRLGQVVGRKIDVDAEYARSTPEPREEAPLTRAQRRELREAARRDRPRVARIISTTLDVLLDLPTPEPPPELALTASWFTEGDRVRLSNFPSGDGEYEVERIEEDGALRLRRRT